MRIEKVVIGIDFSTSGTKAAQWVVEQFAPNAEFIFAHVIDLPRTPAFLQEASASETQRETSVKNVAEPQLSELASRLTTRGARTVIRIGRAHEELAKLAADTGADFVSVGPHGDKPRPWKMLGSTAERLARAAAPAVLVVAHARSAPPRRVLVALDDTPIASTVLDWTKTISETLGAEVMAVHVLRESVAGQAASGGPESISKATQWLAGLVEGWLGQGRVKPIVARGHAGDVILDTARDVAADLIILGRRGSGTRIPAIAGSTVSTVLHGAPAPVLVVTEAGEDWIVVEG